ncbi:putative uncharacterized protein DDB_G0282133 [Helianthus annuus]|nr:putative uncharacterized protein DDB_G0282133 [Helianthus annuus]
MASMQIEVAASSSPFSYVSLRDHKRSANIMGYVNSQRASKNKSVDKDVDSSWLPSQSSKTDDSWLPTISHSSTHVTSESKGSRKVENDVDDSWLPAIGESNGKYGTNANELENDIDYSWLPSTFIDNAKHIQKNGNINKNTTKIKTKNTNMSMNKNKNNSDSNNNSNSNNSLKKKSDNDHWALARKVVFQCDQQNQNDCSHLQHNDSRSKSRYVVESPTLSGVSSILQRWKDLDEVKNSNGNGKKSPSNDDGSRSTCKDNKNNTSHSSPTSSTIEDSDANIESNKASLSRWLSCPLPSRHNKDSNPDGAEKEKIRVVDIIKKISREEELAASHATGHENQSLPPIQTTLHHKQNEGEHKGIKHVKIPRHLIRGRQAFETFLIQMERDKHRELKWLVDRRAVSKFPHRGRIQSLLRFKLLRLGPEPKPEDKVHRYHVSKPLESNNCLDIMDLRERFNSGIEKGAIDSTKDQRNDLKNNTNNESPATTTSTKLVEFKTRTKTTTSNKKQEPQPEPEPMTPNQSTQHSTTSSKDVVHKAKFVDSYSSPITRKDDLHDDDDEEDEFYEDEGQFMSAKTSYSQMEDRNRNRRMQALESFHDWMTDSDLDDDESYDTQRFDTYYDWISHISRPKCDWEDMRQARYQEMLHDYSSANGDIQRLLERKSVSSFLQSSLCDRIEQLMVSRIQHSHAEVEKQGVVLRNKEELRKEVEHEDGSMLDEDCRSKIKTKCSDYVDQTVYSELSWRPNDAACNSDTTTTTSPSINRSLSSNQSHNNSTPRSSPAISHQTIEMELIYDLRGHMEQLHHEIKDLRKSIKTCVNMQVKLQHSFNQSVGAATTRSVQRKEMKPPGIVKHNCFICYDAQVDSLLYRCGHMCTCFKCALELQHTSEECPVCEAPIVDVVKAMCS